MFVSGAKRDYENTYCNCSAKSLEPSWCGKWFNMKEPYCILNGGLESRDCPGAWRVKGIDFYASSHPSVCKKSESK